MANVDRPNGYRPVKTFSGHPWYGMVRLIGVADSEDIFVGDLVNLESGLADPAATNDSALLGAAVGFGKKGTFDVDEARQSYNAANLEVNFYDDSANTHTDWVVFYAPADDVIYEAQTATALDLAVGATADLADAAGSATTGISAQEITTSSNADVTVVEFPKLINNDRTLVWGRYWVGIVRAEQAFHA